MSNPKELRKQLRNVVQDLLPELVASELGESIRKELSRQIQARLDIMVKEIQGTLQQIDQRSKDVQGYLVRQTLNPVPAQPLKEGANIGEQTLQQAKQGS